MDKLYRFSPITTEEALRSALEYITVQLEELSLKVLGEKLPVSILKLFPHYPQEYDYLFSVISHMGSQAPISSEKNLYVRVDLQIHGNPIKYIGVRSLDPYRMQVGCGDYEVDNFLAYREQHIKLPFVRDVKDNIEMLEVWDPDIDVLGYVIPRI